MKNELVGDYRIIGLLGAGSVGSAFRAKHVETGQPAAIKFLQSHALAEPEIQRRFVREVAVCEKLNHPNIVRHYDCGLHEDRIYFAMELVNSGSLRMVLKRRQVLPWRDAVECASQICSALQHAHDLGVIHRDLKPDNLFLSDDGKVKLGDFGLARDLNSGRLTLSGQTVGTCKYMPPEQIMGKDELTGAVDLYALGCIVFEMLAGKPPFTGQSIPEIFDHHLTSDPPRLEDLVPDCPPELCDLIRQLLGKAADKRPASAKLVQTALDDILHHRVPISDSVSSDTASCDTANNQSTHQTGDSNNLNLTERLQLEPAVASSPGKVNWMYAIGFLVLIVVVVILASQMN